MSSKKKIGYNDTEQGRSFIQTYGKTRTAKLRKEIIGRIMRRIENTRNQ